MSLKKLKRWEKFDFNRIKTFEKPLREGTDSSDEAREFHRELKNFLKKEFATIGATMLMGHYAKLNYYDITFVFMKNNKYVYVCFGDMRNYSYGPNTIFSNILYRSMKHDKDWSGGQNQYSTLENLVENVERLFQKMEAC